MSSPVGWGTRGIRAAVHRAGPWVQVQTWPWKRSPKETLMPSVEDPEEAPGGGPLGLRVTRAGHRVQRNGSLGCLQRARVPFLPERLPLVPREPPLSEIPSTELDSPCVAGHNSILRTLLKIQVPTVLPAGPCEGDEELSCGPVELGAPGRWCFLHRLRVCPSPFPLTCGHPRVPRYPRRGQKQPVLTSTRPARAGNTGYTLRPPAH